MGLVANILMLILVVLIVIIFYPNIISMIQFAKYYFSHFNVGSNYAFPNSTNPQSAQNTNAGSIINYTLYLINKDRSQYGLPNVTLSVISSGQQHANNMLQYNYFSHWDIYGMKPYMRYTLLGGTESVQENVAYTKSGVKACLLSHCTTVGNINATAAVKQMEYEMIYNDSACCNNGHRDNILDPNHNQVSIGVAYNGSSVYLVEDFINNYINWLNGTPSINSSTYEVNLKGSIASGYKLSTIEITYDPIITNMSQYQLDQTSEYSYGTPIAGVAGSSLDYFPSLTTIVADAYYVSGNNFLASFNLKKLIDGNGEGEYTITEWINGTASGSNFVGSSYTIFVNSNNQIYTPQNV
jgi:uncharacterized protein YkwD